jgi:RecB family exonuclease
MRPLSYSQISTYQTCPLSYKLQYIDGLKPTAKWYFSFGETLHSCAEYFFSAKLPTFPTLEELLDFYQENWSSEGWESPEQESAERTYGEQIIREFWRIHTSNFRLPLAAERLFIVDVEGVKLRGYIDRIDKLDTGGLTIVDYKSNRELFTKEYVQNLLQLTLYQIACEQMWDMPVERLTLYHLRSNTPVHCGPRQKEQLKEARNLVLSVAESIASEKFPAIENQYCPCDFPEYCPYYKHKYGETIPETAKPEQLKTVNIGEIIERYVGLQDAQKMIEKQLDELKQLLIQYCQTEGINRVFGTEHAITYKIIERTGYPEEKVRPILEPAGLWDRVLKFDPAAVRELLRSKEVPEKIRTKIADLAEVISTYPRLWIKTLKDDKEE